MKQYKPVIGLEIHLELKTQAKMFCQCPAFYFGKKPNTQTCPVCLGLPGALPVPNKKAVEWTVFIGKALNCTINKISKFDRKHYFYPDLPKGYQISQYNEPLCINGRLTIKTPSFAKASAGKQNQNSKLKTDSTFRIRRVHLEEDTGKLIHSGDETLIDFNRCGVPLVEIVTEPDFKNSYDVKQFLEELQVLLRYLNVSDCDMEKGTMRLEPNISVMKHTVNNIKHKKELPFYKVEVKNINSFRFVKQAIDYEIKRQIEILEKGEIPIQETRGFNEKKVLTYSQRTKEEAHDYRYFPEPDIPAMVFNDNYIKEIENHLPELPQQKLKRYVNDFKIKYEDAYILTRDKNEAEYFELVNKKLEIKNSKLQLKIQNLEQSIANFIINKKISTNILPGEFVKKALDLLVPKTTDNNLVAAIVNQVVKTNLKAVEDYKKGKQNVLMFLVGQVMKELKGQVVSPERSRRLDAQIIKEKIEKIIKNNQ